MINFNNHMFRSVAAQLQSNTRQLSLSAIVKKPESVHCSLKKRVDQNSSLAFHDAALKQSRARILAKRRLQQRFNMLPHKNGEVPVWKQYEESITKIFKTQSACAEQAIQEAHIDIINKELFRACLNDVLDSINSAALESLPYEEMRQERFKSCCKTIQDRMCERIQEFEKNLGFALQLEACLGAARSCPTNDAGKPCFLTATMSPAPSKEEGQQQIEGIPEKQSDFMVDTKSEK